MLALPVQALAQSEAANGTGAVKTGSHPATDAIGQALRKALSYGDTSFLASVVENTRLTPKRTKLIESEAIALRPEMADKITHAIRSAQLLSSLYPAASIAPVLSAPLVSSNTQLPYPGGVKGVDESTLSEFERNYSLSAMGAATARELGFTGKGVVVGVIDSGFDMSPDGTVHPEFTGRIDSRSTSFLNWVDINMSYQTLSAAEIEEGLQQGPTDTQAVDEHGTHVTGIIAAGDNGFGMEGVAPDATILSVQAIASASGRVTLDSTSRTSVRLSDLQTCGLYALAGAGCTLAQYFEPTISAERYLAQFSDVSVVNMSFGPSVRLLAKSWDIAPTVQPYYQEEAKALRANLDAGQVLVVSAGNDGKWAPVAAENPTGIGLYPFISPANEDATNSSGNLIYNDYGTGLDFSFLSADALAEAEAADGIARGRIV
ncbi:S8 family serine peptidase, partial [Martelella alba]|uniref:S8 family serine peptidase n=1 Tax=Martelella alba TaxID=2590451 RepID=UPI0015E82EA3